MTMLDSAGLAKEDGEFVGNVIAWVLLKKGANVTKPYRDYVGDAPLEPPPDEREHWCEIHQCKEPCEKCRAEERD